LRIGDRGEQTEGNRQRGRDREERLSGTDRGEERDEKHTVGGET
jgi:hypothetical protein